MAPRLQCKYVTKGTAKDKNMLKALRGWHRPPPVAEEKILDILKGAAKGSIEPMEQSVKLCMQTCITRKWGVFGSVTDNKSGRVGLVLRCGLALEI